MIENLGPPVFSAPLKNYVVQVSSVCPVILPKITDPNTINTPSVKLITWGNCGNFVTGKYPTYTLSPINNDTDPGPCEVDVELIDDNPNPKISSYKFFVLVTPLAPVSLSVFEHKTNSTNKQAVFTIPSDTLAAKISSISKSGLVTVTFNAALVIPGNISQIDSDVLGLTVLTASR